MSTHEEGVHHYGSGQRMPRAKRVTGTSDARLVKAPYCDVCERTDQHVHCPECGSTEHVASECDMEG